MAFFAFTLEASTARPVTVKRRENDVAWEIIDSPKKRGISIGVYEETLTEFFVFLWILHIFQLDSDLRPE